MNMQSQSEYRNSNQPCLLFLPLSIGFCCQHFWLLLISLWIYNNYICICLWFKPFDSCTNVDFIKIRFHQFIHKMWMWINGAAAATTWTALKKYRHQIQNSNKFIDLNPPFRYDERQFFTTFSIIYVFFFYVMLFLFSCMWFIVRCYVWYVCTIFFFATLIFRGRYFSLLVRDLLLLTMCHELLCWALSLLTCKVRQSFGTQNCLSLSLLIRRCRGANKAKSLRYVWVVFVSNNNNSSNTEKNKKKKNCHTNNA